MSQKAKEEEIAWIRAMVAKEEELGSLPPGGASGGFGARRGTLAHQDDEGLTTAPMNDLRAAIARADEVLGCGAMPCRFKDTTWQTTNGRCVCLDHPRAGHVLAALYKAAKAAAEEPSRAIKRLDEFIDELKVANPNRVDLDEPLDPELLALVFPALCEICGEQKCPRATSHDNACQGSNEPGRDGRR